MNTQFKKGVLELCVLSLLCYRDRYGYELVHSLSESIGMSEGTMYPLLRRLTKDGYSETYLKESEEGPTRKYYRLTTSGKEQHQLLKSEWLEFTDSVNKIIDEEKEEGNHE